MTLDTPCPLASVTKMFTGTVLMMFVDRGLIDLDAPAENFIPALANCKPARSMTYRALFTHSSGLTGHSGDELRDFEERIGDLYPSLQTPVYFIYNGAGFALGFKGLELMADKPVSVLCRQYLFDPLGCTHTTTTDAHRSAKSTASDVAKLGQMLLNGGAYGHHRFLSPEAVQKMRPARLTMLLGAGTQRTWGIGTWAGLPDGPFEHPSGNSSILRVDPHKQMVIALVATGGRRGKAYETFISVLDRYIPYTAPAASTQP